MKALFNYIKARINTQVPEIKTVVMWNNQFIMANDSVQQVHGAKAKGPIERPFRYPACFVEFQVVTVYNRLLKIRDVELLVRFRFGLEAYKFERLDTFDFCDRFSAALQSMSPTLVSGLNFTSFDEVLTDYDENHDNVETPTKDYRTVYRDLAAYVVLPQSTTLTGVNVSSTSP